MIKPTVGAPVWYWYSAALDMGPEPFAATIAYIHNDRKVNLSVIRHDGSQFGCSNVPLFHGNETYKPVGDYCEWPTQVSQEKNDDAAPYPGANTVADAMAVVTKAMRDDDGYVLGWHANIAIAAIDAGCPRDVAQEAGAIFLNLLANVDVRQRPWFQRMATVAKTVETKTYPDGTTATGTAPLPEQSPASPKPVIVAHDADATEMNRLHGEDYGVDWVYPTGQPATDAPVARVTPDMITRAIYGADYHIIPNTQITVCVITLINGTKLLGHNYGSIDPAQQDWTKGRQAAYDMAREKIWELEGYALRERLAAA